LHYSTKLSLKLAALLLLFLPGILQSQNALYFDGNNDYVQTTYGGILGSANRTFEAWVNVSPGITANNAILDYGLNAVGSRNTFNVGSNYELRFISGGTNANISSASNVVPVGQWAHVAFVLDNGTGYLYVNGTQVGTGSLTTVNTPAGNANLTIGQRVAGGNIPFTGSIDEVRVWNYARSQTEIQNDLNTEFCTVPTGLVAYYQFNQGMAGGSNTGLTNLPDQSGNGYNGTLTNFALTGTSSNWVSGAPLTLGGVNLTISDSACVSYTSPSGLYTWTSSGVYSDTLPSASGCDSIFTINLAILSTGPDFSAEQSCGPYLSPSGQYTWTSSGVYLDTLQNIHGCDSILSINLTVLPNPTVQLGPDSIASCGSITLDAGNPGAGFIWSVPNQFAQTLEVTTSGTYWVETNLSGCTDSDTIYVEVLDEPAVNLGGAMTSCVDVTLDAGNPGSLYLWSTGDTTQTITYTPPATGVDTVSVLVTDANGCDATDKLALSFGTPPVVDLGPDTTECDNFLLDAGNQGASYMWSTTETTQAITVDSSGTYSVTVTDPFGCTNTDEVVVNLDYSPTADPTFNWVNFGYEFAFMANATPGATITWDFGDGSPLSNDPNPLHVFGIDGTYTITLTVTNDCGTFQTQLSSGPVNIDNLFSQGIDVFPNPSSNTFLISGADMTAPRVEIAVYNPAGQVVYTAKEAAVSGLKHQVDLSTQAEGVYLVKISDGERTAYKRVVKQ
jgi:hypothetical protein